MALLGKTEARNALPNIGEYGNSYVAVLRWTGDAAQNDTVYLQGWIPANSTLHDIKFNYDAFGASVTADVGYIKMHATGSQTDDPDGILAGVNVAAAGQTLYTGKPITFTEDTFITVLFEGANPAAASEAVVVVSFEHKRG